jgi:hypothetical protein
MAAMIDLNTLTQDELRFVAAQALWSFDIWSDTPEGFKFWRDAVDVLEGDDDRDYPALRYALDKSAQTAPPHDFRPTVARIAADAIEKAGIASLGHVVAALRQRVTNTE